MVAQGPEFLNAAEQLTLVHDVASLAEVGRFEDRPRAGRCGELREFAGTADRGAGEGDCRAVKAIRPRWNSLKCALCREGFRRARSLGWSAKPGGDRPAAAPELVPFVARYDATLAEARKLADQWLADRTGVDADLRRPVLTTAADHGDRALFDTILRGLKKTQDLRSVPR